MASLMPQGKQQYFDNNGNPLSGGKLYTYISGTSTPLDTYSDQAGTVPNTNPVVLNARGEATIFWGLSPYKVTLKTSADVEVWTQDNLYAQADSKSVSDEFAIRLPEIANYAALRAYSGTQTAYYVRGVASILDGGAGVFRVDSADTTSADNGGTILVDASGRRWKREFSGAVNVLWFGADPAGVADSTAAVTAAQMVGNVSVRLPKGSYKLNGLRIKTGVHLLGDGYDATHIYQASTGTPAINCLSDASVGQLSGLNVGQFTVHGIAGATVAAVSVAAYGAYAVWRSVFDFIAKTTFSALNIQGMDAANVFWCEFKVTSENTSDISVVANGGVYNRFSLFLTQCYKAAYVGSQTAAEYDFLVTEGPIQISDQNSIIRHPVVENLPQFVGTVGHVFADSGFNNTWDTPECILDTASAAKVTTAVFAPFVGTIVRAPRFLMLGTPVANPFAPTTQKWTLIGPGQSGCTNKIEATYDGTTDNKNPRNIRMVGLDSTFTTHGLNSGGGAIQYLAPTGAFNFTIAMGTDTVVWEPSGTIAFTNISFYAGTVFFDGQRITFSSTQTVTTINWPDATFSRVPGTIAANTSFTIVYRAASNAWFRA